MSKPTKILIVGSGNAGLCAGIAALEQGAEVLVLEAAPKSEAGGNSRYTAGAMRVAYQGREELLALLSNRGDSRLQHTDFGAYSRRQFSEDLLYFNEGAALNWQQRTLVDQSYPTLSWLRGYGVDFEPIYSRQAFQKDGQYIFWGGLVLEAKGEGPGLVAAELDAFLGLGGKINYEAEVLELVQEGGKITGVYHRSPAGKRFLAADAVILASGGFEANAGMRSRYLGANWQQAKVRGTPYNRGGGIEMALAHGAALYGQADGCHAVPMDLHMPDYGNLRIPHGERKNYRKICYFLGVMLNAEGERFVDEGLNFRNYTYAQFGRAILEQPGHFAWQLFDAKVEDLLYGEYRSADASFVEADTLEELVCLLDKVDAHQALRTLREFNGAVEETALFDPTILDGRRTRGLLPDKTNWANKLDTPPFRAYPVTCGITFTYGGLEIDRSARVLHKNGEPIRGLFACGELLGGIFYHGYPGGSGLTSGAVFGRLAGRVAAID